MSAHAVPPRAPEVKFAPAAPLDVVLGVDFGTRFTKVCYRVLQEGNRAGVVYVPGPLELAAESALLPSELYVARDGTVDFRPPALTGLPFLALPFIKMRLRSKDISDLAVAPELVHLNLMKYAQPLAAYYLAYVLAKSRRRVLGLEPRLRSHGEVIWSANIGIPAEHYDDPIGQTYRLIAAVAWLWSLNLPVLPNVSDLVDLYLETSGSPDLSVAPTSVYPELLATLARFARQRDTPQAFYGWVDIGGGTLDVAVFRVHRTPAPKVHTFAARVDDLGTAAIAGKALDLAAEPLDRDAAERALVLNDDTLLRGLDLATSRGRVQTTFCQTLMNAKQKLPVGSAFGNVPFEIFFTGGGARSRWYQTAVNDAYGQRRLDRCQIPPFKLRHLDRPQSLSYPRGIDLGRFVVAEGLSHPIEELEEIVGSRPSEVNGHVAPARRRVIAPDYLDTKSLT